MTDLNKKVLVLYGKYEATDRKWFHIQEGWGVNVYVSLEHAESM